MLYGDSYMGYSYSPDRSRDVDRFNASTRSNYPTSYNTTGYYSAKSSYASSKSTGYYDGAGRYHER